MPSPFPGMDPYLERPSLWPGLHVVFIGKLQAALNPQLLPHYIAQIETRGYIVRDEDPSFRLFIADVSVESSRRRKQQRDSATAVQVAEPIIFTLEAEIEIEEARIEIRDRRKNTLVTVIELLSPSNKVRGSEGRESFLEKRQQMIASKVHWLEIDLLRAGSAFFYSPAPPSDYRIYLARGDEPRRMRGWPFSVREKIPAIGVPLGKKDPDVRLDLGAVLNEVYDQAGYEYLLDYSVPPEPPLSPADAKWANALLRTKALR